LADFLPEAFRQADTVTSAPPSAETPPSFNWDRLVDEHLAKQTGKLYDEAIAVTEREIITRVLGRVAGNQVQAAKALGITRTTLRAKMRQLGISLGTIIQQKGPSDDRKTDLGDQ